jgi:hypothetical protein
MTKWSISLTFITYVPVKKLGGKGIYYLLLIEGNTYVPGRKIRGANIRY